MFTNFAVRIEIGREGSDFSFLSKAKVFFYDDESFEKEIKKHFIKGQTKDYSVLQNIFQRGRHGGTDCCV